MKTKQRKKVTTPVAFYGRRSTDKQDKTSTQQQLRSCQEFAQKHNLKIVAKFTDEACSRSDDDRPQFKELLVAAENRDFDGILVEELERLTGRQGTLSNLLEDLEFRNQFLITARGDDSRVSGAELVFLLKGHMSKEELKRISLRTQRGVRERAEKGFSAGGVAYGFKRPEIDPETGEKEVRKWYRHQMDPKTARVVADIFRMYAGNMSCRAIASELNSQGIPSPAAHWSRNTDPDTGKPTDGKWRASAINAMLDNEIYRGVYRWNKRKFKKVPGTGKRNYEWRPKSDWKTTILPFKIVDEPLWARVQRRRAEVREKSKNIRAALRKRNGTGKCGIGRQPKYLLSGILKCDSCGSNFIMRDTRRYKCASQCNGAESACKNTLTTKRTDAEHQILVAVSREILSDENIDRMIGAAFKHARDQYRQLHRGEHDITKTQGRIATLEKQMGHLADAIAASGFTEKLKGKHEELEVELQKELAKLAVLTSGKASLPKLEVRLQDGLTRLRENIEKLQRLHSSPHATALQVARLRDALSAFLGHVPLAPDYKVGALIATIQPTQEALALMAGPAANALAYRSGSGGRI